LILNHRHTDVWDVLSYEVENYEAEIKE